MNRPSWGKARPDSLTACSTENALFTAEDAWVQVRFSHFEALVSLFNALGGGWQPS